MWDRFLLAEALSTMGFVDIQTFTQGECADEMFLRPESNHQFEKGFGLQVKKPN